MILLLGVAILAIGGTALLGFRVPAALRFLVLVLGVVSGLVAASDYNEIRNRIDTVQRESEGLATASVCIGLFLIFFGAVLAIAATFLRRRPPVGMEPNRATPQVG